jgi:hypothetical protein
MCPFVVVTGEEWPGWSFYVTPRICFRTLMDETSVIR